MSRKVTARWTLEVRVDLGFSEFWYEATYLYQYEGQDDTCMKSKMFDIMQRTVNRNPSSDRRITKQAEPEIVWEDTQWKDS